MVEAEDKVQVALPCHLLMLAVPAARVVGKGGASIHSIRATSGASVEILEKELPPQMQRREERVVVISGDNEAMQQAIAAVLERVFDRSGLPEAERSRPRRQHVVEMVVPEKCGSHLVGHRGERIRSLIEETGCDIHVGKESIDGLLEQKVVRLTAASSLEEAVAAVWKLHEVLLELAEGRVLKPEHFELRQAFASGVAQPSSRGASSYAQRSADESSRHGIPVRLLCNKDEAACIVGKRGSRIMKLRDLAKVVMRDADSPPFDTSERIVEISNAGLEQRVRVVQMIVDDLSAREDVTVLRLLVPTFKFGSVMGHRGETIRRIMSSTGASLKQHKAEKLDDGKDYSFRLVEVEGGDYAEVVREVHCALENRDQDRAGVGSTVGGGLAGNNNGHRFSKGRYLAEGDGSSFGDTGSLSFGHRNGVSPPPLRGRPHAAGPLFGPMGGLIHGRNAHEEGEVLTLELAMPSEEVARLLVDDSSGIAWRANVELSVAQGPGRTPLLQVMGTATANSVACYLIQDRLFMLH